MRIALLTEGGYPYPSGDGWEWCDRLVRGLDGQEIDVYALTRAATTARPRLRLPSTVRRVAELPLDGPPPAAPGPRGRTARRRFRAAYRDLAHALAAPPVPVAGDPAGRAVTAGEDRGASAKDRFVSGLCTLADLAEEHGGLGTAPLGQTALAALEDACRTGAAGPPRTAGLLTAAGLLERALRPLSAPWFGDGGLESADLCHATSGGPAALPGLLAARRHGTPLLVTEYAVRLREQYLRGADRPLPPPARALSAAFHRLLAAEVCRTATFLTAGNAHVRRWQERCGADRSRVRVVPPGMDASALAAAGEAAESGAPGTDGPTLVWVGRPEPAKDLVALLHAFTAIREAVPGARLRIIAAGPGRPGHLERVRALAAQLLPDTAADTAAAGESPVTFDRVGSPGVRGPADAYTAGGVVVSSSAVEGFPAGLVEAMFCGRATVSTDVGAVREVIGGTGLLVPPRNPRALAEACVALLRDPARRSRLGAAARSRALELFTVEANTAAFRALHLDLVAHRPARPPAAPFDHPAEAHVPGQWAAIAPDRPRRTRAVTAPLRCPAAAAGDGR